MCWRVLVGGGTALVIPPGSAGFATGSRYEVKGLVLIQVGVGESPAPAELSWSGDFVAWRLALKAAR